MAAPMEAPATRPDTLDVYFGPERVGAIHDTSPLAFEYAAPWLQRSEPVPVAAIPLQRRLTWRKSCRQP